MYDYSRQYLDNRIAGRCNEPHILQRRMGFAGHVSGYVAVTTEWEGPLRPDYTAAAADLHEKLYPTA